jgi:hypothetical protein
MRGEGPFAQQIDHMFQVSCRRADLNRTRTDLSTAAFRRVLPNQLDLAL